MRGCERSCARALKSAHAEIFWTVQPGQYCFRQAPGAMQTRPGRQYIPTKDSSQTARPGLPLRLVRIVSDERNCQEIE